MRVTNHLECGKTYIFSKRIIEKNRWTSSYRKVRMVEAAFERLNHFILPIAEVLSFVMVGNRLTIVLKVHPEEIIRQLPRQKKHMTYRLTTQHLNDYLTGKLGSPAGKGAATCEDIPVHVTIRKKLANFLQSFTILYNRLSNRSDRLSARKTDIIHLENEAEIRNAIVESQLAPVVQKEANKPDVGDGNILNPKIRIKQEAIHYSGIANLFWGKYKNFEQEVFRLFDLVQKQLNAGKFDRDTLPGFYRLEISNSITG